MDMKPTKSFHIETWGCQMNTADSEQMASILMQQNYQHTADPQQADLIILNTCHIREKAKHKVMSRLGVLKSFKLKNPNLKICVSGCVAQAEGKKLLDQSGAIDMLLGPGKIEELPKLLNHSGEEPAIALGFEQPHHHPSQEQTGSSQCEATGITDPLDGKNPISRFVNIQKGCNNFCTFCVVPFTRGREISERQDIILAKSKALVKLGAKEITLLGQNVNSYGNDLNPAQPGLPFVELLQAVAKVEGLERLRITTSNPHDLTPELAALFATEPKLGRYFHLPVQSGSDTILKAMKRKVTQSSYLEKIQWLRQAVPDMAISTDLIVGFPQETEDDFEQTLDLVQQVRYSFVYAFKYSQRKGTAAIRFRDQIAEDVKTRRLHKLNQVCDQITLEENALQIGRTLEVLFLYQSQKSQESNVYYGRDAYFRLVRCQSHRNPIGKILPVLINNSNKIALSGTLV